MIPATTGIAHDAAAPGGDIVAVDNLSVVFEKPRSLFDILAGKERTLLRAVDGVSLKIATGETLGLVGESGSGKSTIARAIMRLVRPADGSIRYAGKDIHQFDREGIKAFRRSVQMVFQDPYSSLNPRLSIGAAIEEALRFHDVVPQHEAAAEVRRLLSLVGLPAAMTDRMPRQLSGGQRQRVGLARALAVRPKVLVLDEPVAALDVSIQAQVLNLLRDLSDELKLTMLFVAHELGVVRHMSDRVAILYLGRIMETGTATEIFERASHPYTRGLLAAVPRLEPVKRARKPVLDGEIPSPMALPSGCRFRTRCPMATAQCASEPPIVQLSSTHFSACHYARASTNS